MQNPETVGLAVAGTPLFFLRFESEKAVAAASMPFLKNGGLFIPGPAVQSLGEKVFLLVSLPGASRKQAATATVAWLFPEGGAKTGIGVSLDKNGSSLKSSLENLQSEQSGKATSFTV